MRNLFASLCLILQFFIVIIADHAPSKSPRDEAIKKLAALGCSNRVVANIIIDAYKSGVGINTLNLRLSGITSYSPASLSAW
jgi:hypothetical protein